MIIRHEFPRTKIAEDITLMLKAKEKDKSNFPDRINGIYKIYHKNRKLKKEVKKIIM